MTADGCEVITRFPAEDLLVCGTRYWTVDGALPTLRESQSHLNTAEGRRTCKCAPPPRWTRRQRRVVRADGQHDPIFPEPFDDSLDQADIPIETRLELYRKQQEIRQLEQRLYDLFVQNLVKGTSHLALGMEAAGAAFGVVLNSDDYSFATYRGHGRHDRRGVPPEPIIAEMLGRSTGLPREARAVSCT